MATLNPSRPSSKLPLILAIILGLAAVIGGGLFAWSRLRPAPAANLPPIVVNRVPERGEEQGTESPIVVSFDKPMDRASVEQSVEISPRIPGSFKWNDTNTAVQFVPTGSGFARGETYNVTLADTAKAENGKTLGQPIVFTFKAVGFIDITQVMPADGAQEIDPASEITVMFNRPIVPIRSASDTTPLPEPVTFDPPLTGKGEWLNTSIYVFRPDKRLESGVKYTAKIAAGLQDPTGAILLKDYVWTFTTQLPQVIAFSPSDAESEVWIDAAVKVTFNQPMDHASSEAVFSLHQGAPDGPQVAGVFGWYTTTLPGSALPVGAAGHFAAPALGGGGGQSTSDFVTDIMVFTPTQHLERDVVYYAKMVAGAKGFSGGAATGYDNVWSFTTVKPLYVIRTDPANGGTAAPYSSMEIYFSTPMDEASLRNITVTTPIEASSVYTYYSDYDRRYVFGFGAGPSSSYQVLIGQDVADKWGVKLGQDQTINFRTRALPPEQWFDVPGRFGVYSAYTDTVVYARYRNVSQLNFELYPVGLAEFGRLIASDGWQAWERDVPANSAPVRTWSVPVDKPLNTAGLMRVPIASESGGALTTGIYLIRVTSPEQSERDFGGITRHLIVVANTNLTFKKAERESLVWATDLQSGREIPAGSVTLYNDLFQSIASGLTDGTGLYRAQFNDDVDPFRSTSAVFGQPGGSFGVALSDWNSGIGPWDFGVNSAFFFEPHSVYIYTEKPLYRPGQPVHFKGVVRLDDDARYAIDPNLKQVDVVVYDALGTQIYTATLPLTDYGSFNADFTLDAEAALGGYSIQAQIPGKTPDFAEPQMRTYYGTFLVSEYRRPEFQVTVTPKQTEVLQGDTVEVDVQASYFFGGLVSGAKVNWTAVAQNYFFDRYAGPGYFSWNDVDYFAPSRGGSGGVLASGEGVTDAQGNFKITLPAKLDEKTGSQRFSIEAAVTDISDQQVANRVDVIVHQGRYYIGVAPVDYVGTAGQPMAFDLRTVDWQAAPAANQTLNVVYYQREWYNVQQKDDYGNVFWTSAFSDTAVFTTTATTNDKGEGTTSFTPPTGGEYRVVASGTDDRGNSIRASAYVWVSSREYVSWRQDNNDRIALVADKKAYNPGETAKILIPSPYQGVVRALVTVERGRVLDAKVIDLQTNSDVIEIPITPDMAPNAFVSVVIVKGVDQNELAPSFKMGYAAFTVNRDQQILKVTLTPDKDPATQSYAPRAPIAYTLKVLDFAGNPVQAEVSLALVDLSVLTLLDPFAQAMPDFYYSERGLSVMTSASLVYSVDRINIKLAEEAKGGGGGAAEGGDFFVRGNFPDTAYWNATVTTDANGEAKINTVLPDNLTTWRMLAKAVTKDTLVGEGQVDIRSTKDLLIRPVTPRFMVVGDKLTMAAVVNNNTAKAIDADVSLEGTGLTIDNGQVKQTVSVPANGQVRVEWPVTVQDAPHANLTFTARGGGLTDASKPTAGLPPEQYLPIYKFSTPETTATAGNVTKDDPTRVEVIALPAKLDTTQGELTVKIDPSLAAASTDALKYLEHFPYECTEQTVSRFLPNVLTYRALKELNLVQPELEADLKEQVSTGLQRLYNQQHTDGGWGWWVQDKSDVTVSTYVVFGLVKAQQAGLAVDAGVIDRGVAYLIEQIKPATQINQTWQANQQAYLLYTLAEAGQSQTSSLVALFDSKRQVLGYYGKALLALGLKLDQPAETSRVSTLLNDLVSGAKASATGLHWEEPGPDWYSWNTDTRSTAIVLDAIAQIDPKNQLGPNVVRWLMMARTAGRWETTQETAWSLIALTDWMKATGELNPDYNWVVKVNDQTIGSGTANRDTVKQSVTLSQTIASLLIDQGNALSIERSFKEPQSGDGQLYYAAYLRTFLPVPEVQALSRGVSISRQYYASSDPCFLPLKPGDKPIPCTPVTKAKVGDVLQVKLSIVAPTDLYYVMVEDPLPAGTEAVDTSLKTTTQVGEDPQLNPVEKYSYYGGWGWWWFTHTELRDEKVALFASYLPAGSYEYTYQVRAGMSGTFNVIPAHAEQMYFPEVFGRSDGSTFVIEK